MGWIFELCQNPKLFSGNPSGQKIIDVIPDRIICRWTLYNIINMSFAAPAFCNEIQPLIREIRKNKIAQNYISNQLC